MAETGNERVGLSGTSSAMGKWHGRPSVTTRLFFPVLAFALPFLVYTATLAPSITWRNEGADGAELTAAAYVLGVAHPPGYPLYILLGHLFSWIPLGNVAYRLNLMSAVFGGGACVWVYVISRDLLERVARKRPGTDYHLTAAAFVAAVLYGFSPLLWSQSTIAEVNALHAFWIGALAWLALRWMRAAEIEKDSVWAHSRCMLYVLAFFFGIGLGNHLTLAFLLPSVLLWIVAGQRPSVIESLIAGAFLVIGLAIYAYLPLRAATYPAVNWGDPAEWDGFVWLVSGQLYQSYLASLSAKVLDQRILSWAALLLQQFTALGLGAGIFGLVTLWERSRKWVFASIVYFLIVSLFAVVYQTKDSYVYLLPAYLIFAIWMAAGLFRLFGLIERWANPLCAAKRMGLILIVALAWLFPWGALIVRWPQQDLHADWMAHNYAEEALGSVEAGAVIIAETDEHLFSLWYFQYVENRRPDVSIVAAPLIDYAWYRKNLRRLYPRLIVRETGDNTPRLWTLVQDNLHSGPMGRSAIYLTDPNPVVRAAFALSLFGNLFQVHSVP